ncbi:MaoC family dehydratase N-terminal domain-containing protein [Actinomadura roseirufa]|uniref:MaoC family dehydratase N-terminal domain-containing protein n=1 Tax=Actinomadura roseirufa TaxID=2094049 RepID=UPI0010419C97|nr:MaoC family dehydratase N-terminal domain-containing protein [Actinomadura roseirufa]
MIDRSAIGTRTRPFSVDIGRDRLRAFALASGETDPVYTDLEAARRAGHPDLPVPQGFLFSLEMEQPEPLAFLDRLGVDIRRVLHGEQIFTYRSTAYAGDRLTASIRIDDIYSKRDGALEFIVRTTEWTRRDAPIAELTSILVVQNAGAAE